MLDVFTAQFFKFGAFQCARVYGDASLPAAKRQADSGSFEAHQRGQRSDFVNFDFRMEAYTAFVWSAFIIMLYAVGFVLFAIAMFDFKNMFGISGQNSFHRVVVKPGLLLYKPANTQP